MKSLIYKITFCLLCLLVFNQAKAQIGGNYISLKKGNDVKIDSIFAIHETTIEYVANGSVHDMDIAKIDYIRNKGKEISFDAKGKAIIVDLSPDKRTIERKSEPKDTTTEIVEKPKVVYPTSEYYKMNVGFYPLTLLEPDRGLRFGLEIPFDEHLSLVPDINYIFAGYQGLTFDISQAISSETGFSTHLDLRYYVYNSKRARFYLAPNAMYKDVKINYEPSVSSGFFPSVNNVSKKVTVYSFNVKTGFMINLDSRFTADIYAGVGLRNKKEVLTRSDGTTAIPSSSNAGVLPNVLCGIAIGYRFGNTMMK
ncbi:MAG: hypothetical protein NTX03_11665 [Bacteroidetes bacterium]|nr:hypothetical protein [Bacteroidota bacterium]